MPCEMCGKDAPTRPTIVEGTELQLCAQCGKFGKSTVPEVTGRSEVVKRVQEVQRKRTQTSRPSARKDPFAAQEDLAIDYPQRIQRARNKSGLTQDDFAQKLGIKKSLLQHIERGDARPSDRVARQIEREFNVKLFEAEPVAAPEEAKAAAPGKQKSGPLTMGDLLKKAMDKENE